MYGNSSVSAAHTILVADTISMVGTSSFSNNYAGLTGGSPIKQVSGGVTDLLVCDIAEQGLAAR